MIRAAHESAPGRGAHKEEERKMGKALRAACVAATAALALVGAASTADGASPNDSAVGGGITSFGTTFGFSAHSGPAGQDPTGHVRTRSAFFGLETLGHVTCVRVEGKRAS